MVCLELRCQSSPADGKDMTTDYTDIKDSHIKLKLKFLITYSFSTYFSLPLQHSIEEKEIKQ